MLSEVDGTHGRIDLELVAKNAVAEYERPGMAEAVEEELMDFVARRMNEIAAKVVA